MRREIMIPRTLRLFVASNAGACFKWPVPVAPQNDPKTVPSAITAASAMSAPTIAAMTMSG